MPALCSCPFISSLITALTPHTTPPCTPPSLLGFEGVTEKDEFPTHMLEKRLATTKVINLETAPVARGTIFGFEEKQGYADSDDEWDD